jgi:hypothetical protein
MAASRAHSTRYKRLNASAITTSSASVFMSGVSHSRSGAVRRAPTSPSARSPAASSRGRRGVVSDRLGCRSATAGRSLGRSGGGALEAEHAVGQCPQAGGGDRLAAGVAESVGACVELGQCPFGPGEAVLERVADADLSKPADRLDRAVTDPLAEALRRAELWWSGECGDALARPVATVDEKATDRLEVRILHTRRPTRLGRGLARRPGDTRREPDGDESCRASDAREGARKFEAR